MAISMAVGVPVYDRNLTVKTMYKKTLAIHHAAAAVFVCLAFQARAGSFDALVEAYPSESIGPGYIEIGGDFVNDTVDVLGIKSSAVGINTADGTGDYSGANARFGLALSDNLWVDGAYQKRQIKYGVDQLRLDSYDLATQWTQPVSDYFGGVRASFNSNRSARINRTGTLELAGFNVDALTLGNTQDSSNGLHLLWGQRFDDWRWTSFLGVSRGSTNFRAVSARIGAINLTYTPGGADLISSAIDQDADMRAQLGTLRHTFTRTQAGVNLGINRGPWRYQAGIALETVDRPSVSTYLASAGEAHYNRNLKLIATVNYENLDGFYAYVRGQYMSNQFLSDIPLLYNSITARRFNQRYGYVSVGVGRRF